MSIHPNPDGSQTEGYKAEPNGTFISHVLGTVATTVQTLSTATPKANGANQAVVQADGQDLRFTLDGSTPTTSLGFLIKNGTSFPFNMTDAAAAKFIAATAGGLMNVLFTM
jgi:hypothetical protein